MAYVLANENISTEEFEDQIINAVPEPVKADKPKNQAEFVEVPKATPVVKKVEEEEKPKTKSLALQKPTLIFPLSVLPDKIMPWVEALKS